MGEVGLSLVLYHTRDHELQRCEILAEIFSLRWSLSCAAVVVSVIGVIATGHFDASNLPAYGAEGKVSWKRFCIYPGIGSVLYVGFDCIPQAAEEYDFPPQKCKC